MLGMSHSASDGQGLSVRLSRAFCSFITSSCNIDQSGNIDREADAGGILYCPGSVGVLLSHPASDGTWKRFRGVSQVCHAGIRLHNIPGASPELNTMPVCHQGPPRQASSKAALEGLIHLVPGGFGVHCNGARGSGFSRPWLSFPECLLECSR